MILLTRTARTRENNDLGILEEAKSPQIDRSKVWKYCQSVCAQSIARAKAAGVPHNITPHDIDELFVDQRFRCAVSGIALEDPGTRRNPFGPSLDRIVPKRGYVRRNVRVVCQIVNMAMNVWGEDALHKLVAAMAGRQR